MADDTSGLFGGMDFGDILNAALAIYGIRQGQKPPKFYTAPLTPNEAWKSDATKNLFNYASQYTNQYLQGLGNLNPDYKLNSSELGNPSFMGGVQVPKVDWSKMPSAPSTTTTGPANAPSGGGGMTTPTGAAGGQPGYGTPGYASPFDTMPSSGVSGGVDWSNPSVQQVAQFIKEHPNMMKLGAGAIASILGPAAGLVAGGVISWLASRASSTQPLTVNPGLPSDMTPSDLTPAPDPNAPPQFTGDVGMKQPWIVPGTPGSGVNEPPVDWRKYYDPMAGAPAIGGLLGGQMTDSGGGMRSGPFKK